MQPGPQNWLKRTPSAKDRLRYRCLIELHQITLEWITELKLPDLQKQIAMATEKTLPGSDHLWVFESWESARFEDVIDDLSPGDFLTEVEKAIQSIQKQVLDLALIHQPKGSEEFKVILSRMEQASWRSGRRTAELLWKDTQPQLLRDLKAIFLSTIETAIHPGKGLDAYLFSRVAAQRIELDLIDCPHHWVLQFHHADELCWLHFHWLRGFVYALNPAVQIDQKTPGKYLSRTRC